MSEEDPNADLIGQTIILSGTEWVIDSTCEWSKEYVYLTQPGVWFKTGNKTSMIIRPAGVIRRSLELTP